MLFAGEGLPFRVARGAGAAAEGPRRHSGRRRKLSCGEPFAFQRLPMSPPRTLPTRSTGCGCGRRQRRSTARRLSNSVRIRIFFRRNHRLATLPGMSESTATNSRAPTHTAYVFRREGKNMRFGRWLEIGAARADDDGAVHVFLDRLPVGGFTGHVYLAPAGSMPPMPEAEPRRSSLPISEDGIDD